MLRNDGSTEAANSLGPQGDTSDRRGVLGARNRLCLFRKKERPQRDSKAANQGSHGELLRLEESDCKVLAVRPQDLREQSGALTVAL